MAEEEFMKVYDDRPHLSQAMVNMIDAFIFNSREEIDNAAEIARQNYTMNE